jgi:hypothetical protein
MTSNSHNARGRQRKSSTGEARTKVIQVCVSETEQQCIKDRAGSLSMSEFLLRAGLGQSIPQRRRSLPVPEVNRRVYMELGNVSNNLNQIARACNQAVQLGQSIEVDSDVIRQMLAQMKEIRLAVIGAEVDQEYDDD